MPASKERVSWLIPRARRCTRRSDPSAVALIPFMTEKVAPRAGAVNTQARAPI